MDRHALAALVQTALSSEFPAPTSAHPASRPDLHGDLPGIAGTIGDALRRLHEVPVPAGPDPLGHRGWSGIEARITNRLDAGEIIPTELPEPFCRYDPEQLVAHWAAGRPCDDDLVVCVGDARLENLLLAGGQAAGCESAAEVTIADRHLDLAGLHLSVGDHLGPDAVFAFYDAYGTDPILPVLDHYVVATVLLGRA